MKAVSIQLVLTNHMVADFITFFHFKFSSENNNFMFCFVERSLNYLSIQDNLEKSSTIKDEALEDSFNYCQNTTLSQSEICSEIKDDSISTTVEKENLLEENKAKPGLFFLI
jgi:hypothetical protein